MDATLQDACKLAVAVCAPGTLMETCNQRGNTIRLQRNSAALSIECSDWMDDGRISICGDGAYGLCVMGTSVNGPFTLDLFRRAGGCYECYVRTATCHVTQTVAASSVHGMFKTKALRLYLL